FSTVSVVEIFGLWMYIVCDWNLIECVVVKFLGYFLDFVFVEIFLGGMVVLFICSDFCALWCGAFVFLTSVVFDMKL
ncbi:hypothetical protein NQU36_29840, partial [Escherichia coli]|uniref:hypothetical protein n=1 Tax=Escherichia coli TaxID=562 RepID=UPI0021186D80